MTLVIRKTTIAELESAPNISELLEEYARESSIIGLPPPSAKVSMYKHMESTGSLYVIGAFVDDILIGYVTVLKPVLPHYSIVVAVTESFFVAKEYRGTGAGTKLRQEAENYAKKLGSPGLLISAPIGGILAEVLPHVGYTETNRVFFKGFSENELAIIANHIPSMNSSDIDKIYQFESITSKLPQANIQTSHIVHAGMYARSIMIPAGVVLTGVLVKIATLLIIQGDVIVYIGDKALQLMGYNVLPASANRKQAFFAKTDTYMTMIFPSNAKNIYEAENMFTDEADILLSRKESKSNHIIITGE